MTVQHAAWKETYNKKNLIRMMLLSKDSYCDAVNVKNNLLNNVILLYFFKFTDISVDRDFAFKISYCNYKENTLSSFWGLEDEFPRQECSWSH